MSEIKLMHGDCLELMEEIPNGSIDLILTDPPYGIMQGAALDGWERKNLDWDEKPLDDDFVFGLINDKLRSNGKAILFAQEPYTSSLIKSALPATPFLYRAIWYKDNHANPLSAKKAMVSRFEDICIFKKAYHKWDYECTHPLRQYFADVLEYIGYNSYKEINNKLGHRRAEHSFCIGSSQFSLCTKTTYQELIDVFHIDKMKGFKEFEELNKINNRWKLINCDDKYPAIFNLWQGNKSKPNVLEYAKDTDKYHPTQKPVALLEDLIQTFSNEGDTVLDFTMGSGSTGVACVNTNRNFIGIELDDEYFNISRQRIEEAQRNIDEPQEKRIG